ncbi:MAG: integration host factor subunit beta [Phreatobacter sp.]|nr:integration host factor subunit beta [Phreatobacter sp.]
MIKSKLILRIAAQNPHLYERDVEAVANAILGRISDALVAGDRVELRGFGAFTVKAREARTGRNPKTGEAVPVADKRVLAFKVVKGMQARLDAPAVPALAKIEATAGTAPVPRGAQSWG